ncbi:MAG: AMP-binding protein [Acidimicrobiales bacterium]
MADVVAIDLPGGPEFVDTLRRVWDAGDAALPLDPRLPVAWRSSLIDALAPTAIVEADGARRSLDGRSTEDGDAVIIPTSGTTGVPKGVVLTHDAIRFSAFASMTYLGVDADVTWLGCLPLHHIGGFSVISRALVCETGLVVLPSFDAVEVELAALAGATHVSLVPTTLRRIDPTLFRRILLGGSAIPADRPSNSVATYGMTESGAGVVYDGQPLNGVGLRIDADGGISLSGPTMLRCYRDGTDPLDRDGWYRTGDVGSVDPATGLLTVTGRADEMIISGGENVWPGPVERLVEADPKVAEAAVVGRDDPEWGQVVTVVVVPADPLDPPSLAELRERVKADLPAWCAPRAMELASSLPRTAIGKLRRREI